jgi:short-subunit dehydrogenase
MTKQAFSERVVVVTGGSAGLGRAIARAFAAEGANVAVIARDLERLRETQNELESSGVRCLAIAADVADYPALERATEIIEQRLGPIDVWVNNAMTTVFGRVDAISSAEFRRVTEVTYLGAVHGTLCALSRMRPRRAGAIVQVGSALAYRAIPLQSAYCGAKHALRGFSDSVRAELIHDGIPIRLVSVHMPGLNTPQFDWCESKMPRRAQPVGEVFQPEVGAQAVVWAAQHARRELYVGWPTVKTVLGNKLFPSLGDRLAARLAFDQQMGSAPEDSRRRGNLYQPVAARVAARGRFERRARQRSLLLSAAMYRRPALLGLGVLTAAGVGLLARSLLHRARS